MGTSCNFLKNKVWCKVFQNILFTEQEFQDTSLQNGRLGAVCKQDMLLNKMC